MMALEEELLERVFEATGWRPDDTDKLLQHMPRYIEQDGFWYYIQLFWNPSKGLWIASYGEHQKRLWTEQSDTAYLALLKLAASVTPVLKSGGKFYDR